MIHIAAKYTEPVVSPPTGLELLVRGLSSGGTRTKKSSDSEEKISVPETLPGYDYSYRMHKATLRMEEEGYKRQIASEAMKVQKNGGSAEAYIASKQGEIMEHKFSMLQKEAMVDAYKQNMIKDNTIYKTVADAVNNGKASAADIMFDQEGNIYKIGDYFPDAPDDGSENDKDNPLTIGNYLEWAKSSTFGFNEDNSKIQSNFRGYEVPDMERWRKSFTEAMSGPGGQKRTTITSGDTELEVSPGVTQTGTQKTTISDEDIRQRFDAFLNTAWEDDGLRRIYLYQARQYEADHPETRKKYEGEFDPAANPEFKTASEYADAKILQDWDKTLYNTKEGIYYQSSITEEFGNKTKTDLAKAKAAQEEDERLTYTKALDNSNNFQWDYGYASSGKLSDVVVTISNMDNLSLDQRNKLEAGNTEIFKIKDSKGITYQEARNEWLKDPNNATMKTDFLANEKEAMQSLARKKDGDIDINSPYAYTPIIADANQKMNQVYQIKSVYFPGGQWGSDLMNLSSTQFGSFWAIGGVKYSWDNTTKPNMVIDTRDGFRMIQGLPDGQGSDYVTPKLLVNVIAPYEEFEKIQGMVNGEVWNYGEHEDDMGIVPLGKPKNFDQDGKTGLGSRFGDNNKLYRFTILLDATQYQTAFDLTKQTK